MLWASDATWVIGLACYVGEGPVKPRGFNGHLFHTVEPFLINSPTAWRMLGVGQSKPDLPIIAHALEAV